MASVDLWPDTISVESEIETPRTLLLEQAKALGAKTANLVVGNVVGLPSKFSGHPLADSFSIMSTTLGYEYPLFEIHYPWEIYPAFVLWEEFSYDPNATYVSNQPSKQVNSQQELEEVLREIFAHEKTLKIIQALIARAKS